MYVLAASQKNMYTLLSTFGKGARAELPDGKISVIGDLAFASERVISYSRLLGCCNSQAVSENNVFLLWDWEFEEVAHDLCLCCLRCLKSYPAEEREGFVLRPACTSALQFCAPFPEAAGNARRFSWLFAPSVPQPFPPDRSRASAPRIPDVAALQAQ